MSDKATAPEIKADFQMKHIAAKLAEVQLVVERIPKRGHNQHFNYDFATESDITAAIRREMAVRSLMLIPDIKAVTYRDANTKNGIQTIARVDVQFRVMDGVTGEELTFGGTGEGADSGDKCVPKAITSALKYALLKLFLIPTGDDPEIDHKPKAPQSEPPCEKSRPEASQAPPRAVQGPIANALARAVSVPVLGSAERMAVNGQPVRSMQEVRLDAAYGPAGEPETTEVPEGYTQVLRYACDEHGWHQAILSRPAGVEVKTRYDTGLLLKQAFYERIPAKVRYNTKGYVSKVELLKGGGGDDPDSDEIPPPDDSSVPF